MWLQVSFFSVHCAGCIFYMLTVQYKYPQNTLIGSIYEGFLTDCIWNSYVKSVYWATTTMATVGYGDLHPQTTQEMIFATCFMFFNLGMGSYIIGNMTYIIVDANSRTRKYVKNQLSYARVMYFSMCHVGDFVL